MSVIIRLTIFLIGTLWLNVGVITAQDAPSKPRFYYFDYDQVYRYDPDSRTHTVIETGAESALYNASISPDGRYLAYMEVDGVLRWIDLQTNEITTFPPRPQPDPGFWPDTIPYTSHVLPLDWSSTGKLLLNQAIWEGNNLGWTSVDEPFWHDFPPRPPLPELANPPSDPTHYGLGYEAWSPDGGKLLFASGGPGTAAVFLSGLTLIDFDHNTAHRIVAEGILYPPDGTSLIAGTGHPSWSADNQRIAFTMQINILFEAGKFYFPYGLYVARPDGTNRKLIAQDTKTQYVGCTIWSAGGSLAYVYLNAEPVTDPTQQVGDLYIYQPQSETTVVAASAVGCPIALSGDGRFLSYFQGNDLIVMSFTTQEKTKLVEQIASTRNIVGWTIE